MGKNMKDTNKKQYLKMILLISLVVALLFIFNFIISLNSKIIVIVKTEGGWITSGNTYYYRVAPFGLVKCSRVENNAKEYIIGDQKIGNSEIILKVDNELEIVNEYENEELFRYVRNMTEIINNSNLDQPVIGKVFVVNNRYFITVLDHSPQKTYYDILYEYNIKNNSLKEKTKIKGKSISGIYVKYDKKSYVDF